MTKHSKYLPATLTLAATISLSATESALAQEIVDSGDDFFAIEEIIVTAQRRSQSIQEVANSIDAITGVDLDELNKVGLEDYINSIGGTGFTRSGSGSVKIGMRGISPVGQIDEFAFASTVSTVGMYLDDVAVQGAGALPDMNLYDLQRIEVLKGPQGTLYGDGAMGGAIKMVLNNPDLQKVEGKAEATALDTHNADIGHRVRGAVNIPLIEDKLAVRLVASSEEKKGWIDNIATGEDGVNDTEAWSLRATMLAQITDEFSAELLVLHDQQENDGYATTVTALGDLETSLLEDQFNDVEVDLYALTLKYDLEFAEFTSITSLFEKERTLASRINFSLDEFFIPVFFGPSFGFEGLPLGYSDNSILAVFDNEETFSQELRLVSSGDNAVDWTVGLFYRDRQRDSCTTYDSPAHNALNDYLPDFVFLDLPATTFDCDVSAMSGLDSVNRTAEETFEQHAAYGEFNWEFTNSLELTMGLRYFREEVTFVDESLAYGAFSVFGFNTPASSNKSVDEDVLFKVGLSWTATNDQLYYFNIAEGFRSGGSNLHAASTLEPDRFRTYDSDSLINYEIGAKTSWYNGRLTLNGALYFSDWSDIQASISVPSITSASTSVLTPAGDAEVKGMEVMANYLFSENFSSGLSVTFQEAEFTDTLPDSNIVKGSDLPNAPDLTVSLFAQYTHTLDMGELFTRVEYRFVDDQRSVVKPVAPFSFPYDDDLTILPSYEITNLTVGLRTDSWYLTAYAHNLFDERYALSYGYASSFITAGSNPDLTSVGTPRTLGVTVGTVF
ncbi:TonB-dependent receptor [Pseudomaricurvus alkylphenolicus]|uniref:TonB-dependent receptor n=1 Tax=Pseudomaricurvus alkylphenolicus TaxID=1306991 RepID=UPI001420D6E3|nr:TonB-dependent receptor [Pseudomaricurvus alkylphenolicus]NIB38131.1 TonB-dependent receptor [Pseudomaricurvus alkylphenolicus]